MGCDIHTVVEIKRNGKWEGFEETPEEFCDRNYSLFAFLADVRNNFNTKGFKPKGFPQDFSEMTKKELLEDWQDDLHSASYLTLKELDECDKSDYYAEKCKIVKDFYDKFIELGGKLPEVMEIEKTKPKSFVSCIQESFEPTVVVKWQPNNEKIKKYPLFKGIEELKIIAKKFDISDYENIRIVFGFDN